MANHTRLQTRLRALRARQGRDTFLDALERAKGLSRVTSDDTSLVSSDGTLSVSSYGLNKTIGTALIGGTHGSIAALADVDILTHARATKLDGSAPVALTAGQSCIVSVLAALVSDVPADAFVFGDSATSGSEVAPTLAQCREALRKKSVANHLPSGLGMETGRITYKRVDQVTFTYSGTPDPGPTADKVTIDYNGVEVVNYDIASAVLNTEVAAIRALLVTALAAEPVTVGGAGAVITITADDGVVLQASSSAVVLGGAGDLAVVKTDTDTMTATHTDPATDHAAKAKRLAGALG